MTPHNVAAVACAGVVLAGCTAWTPNPPSGKPEHASPAKFNDAALTFFPASAARAQIDASDPPVMRTSSSKAGTTAGATHADDSAREMQDLDRQTGLAEGCGAAPPTSGALGARSVIPGAWIGSEVGDWAVGALDDNLKKVAKKYSFAQDVRSKPFDFYATLAPAATTDAAAASSSELSLCFRLSRREPDDAANPDASAILVTDFVAKATYRPDADARREFVTLQPLRLYVHRVDIRSPKGEIAVTIHLSADVTSIEASRAETTRRAIDSTLVAEKLTVDGDGLVVAPSDDAKKAGHGGKDDAKDDSRNDKAVTVKPGFFYVRYGAHSEGVDIPLPPWDLDAAAAARSRPAHNATVATVSITEVGQIPWVLENVEKLLDKNKDKLGSELADALKKVAAP
ncbi:MAG TPA: hypothetical protein VMU33_03660 [Burkholderiaceae bacterium]|nr:hypothetical protein [Burkholderiaceae bacterium]